MPCSLANLLKYARIVSGRDEASLYTPHRYFDPTIKFFRFCFSKLG